MNEINAKLTAKGSRFAIIVGRFNEFISNKLAEGAIDCIIRHDGLDSAITKVYVPGAFEIPAVAKRLAESGKFDAVLCLGAVIRGATPHFDMVANECTKGIAQVGFTTKIPVIFGVLTTDSIEQAIERAGTKSGNKGWDSAMAGIEMINLYKEISNIK